MTTSPPSKQARAIPWGALGPWLALLATCTFFATQADRFLTGENLSLVLAASHGRGRTRHRSNFDYFDGRY